MFRVLRFEQMVKDPRLTRNAFQLQSGRKTKWQRIHVITGRGCPVRSPATQLLCQRERRRSGRRGSGAFVERTKGVIAASVKKHSSGEEHTLEHKLSEHQIRGWIAVSVVGLQGEGLRKRNVFSQTPVVDRKGNNDQDQGFERNSKPLSERRQAA